MYRKKFHIHHKYGKIRGSKNLRFWHCWRSRRKKNWTYTGRPSAIQDVFWMCYVRPMYVLFQKVVYITCFITIKGYVLTSLSLTVTTQNMKFCIKDFFSKCDQIRRILRIWSHFLKKFLTENFCAVSLSYFTEWWTNNQNQLSSNSA